IYGWNGTGKSTLAKLFRHLEKRSPITEGQVTFTINGEAVDDRSLDTVTEEIRVFNAEFITENVFTASNHLSPIYVIGEENITKQEALNDLWNNFSELQRQLGEMRNALLTATKNKDKLCTDQARLIKDLLGAHGNRYTTYNKRRFTEMAE